MRRKNRNSKTRTTRWPACAEILKEVKLSFVPTPAHKRGAQKQADDK